MLTVAVVAVCLAALVYFMKKPPTIGGPSAPAPLASLAVPSVTREEPDRRLQLLARKLQDVADERLINDALEDLGVARAKPTRPAPAPV